MRPVIYKTNGSNLGFPHLLPTVAKWRGLLMEIFGTFFLVFSIVAVAVHRKGSPAVCALVIGATLFFGIACFGPITGGAFNPARVFGPSLIGGELFMSGFWIYYLGPIIGGILGALVYHFIFRKQYSGFGVSYPNNQVVRKVIQVI